MSGFLGVLQTDGAPVDDSLVARLMPSLTCCGPDGQAVWRDGGVALGHALLRETFESDDERQPCSLDGQVWLTADVRLDGRAELISRLHGRDRMPRRDAPDAELLLHAYLTWGDACVDHLRGDFSFALWDGRTRRLFCARDHFGQRPFYYAALEHGVAVSSALNCLRRHPAVSDRLNEEVVGDFLLANGNQNPAATTFADILQLPPAHCLIWDGALRVRRYWTLPDAFEPRRFAREAEYVDRFGMLFQQAVSDRVRTTHVGAHLSGGMDSTSIVAAAHRVLRERGAAFELRAYTVVARALADEEEGPYGALVASALGIPCEQLVGDDFFVQPPEADPAWVFPEPCMIPNQTPTCEITRRVSAFSRVLLMGFGGDALFHEIRSAWSLLSSRHQRATLRELSRAWLVHGCRPRLGLRSTLRRWTTGPPVPEVPTWISHEFAGRTDLADRLRQRAALIAAQRHAGSSEMLAPFWITIFNWSHPGFTGLPVQPACPFFDLRLVEFVGAAPPLPWREDKRLLRDAMRGYLPEPVRQRPKRLFHASNKPADSNNPWYKLSRLSDVRRWRRDLVSTTPALAQFVTLDRLLELIETPDPGANFLALDRCFALADWLRHQVRRQGAFEKGESNVRVVQRSTGGRREIAAASGSS